MWLNCFASRMVAIPSIGVTYTNGYYENLDGNEVYITRTPINLNGAVSTSNFND